MEQNQQGGQGRRGHFHRGRRGPDRRSQDGRQPPSAQADRPARGADKVDVDQIMREIRARIAQRHGIELSNQQVQELAARRLEAILDPRTVDPTLLDQLRKSAGAPIREPLTVPPAEPGYTFDDSTLFDSHRGLLRIVRSILRPILKLFFNPAPLVEALSTQSRLNADLTARAAESERRQSEWNALHFELLQRMVTETARLSLEMQSLTLRVESLSAKVDFNERRVKGIEGVQHQLQAGRQSPRGGEPRENREVRESRVAVAPAPRPEPVVAPSGTPEVTVPQSVVSPAPAADGQRRRRRRRRGRRGTGVPADGTAGASGTLESESLDQNAVTDFLGESDEDESAEGDLTPDEGSAATVEIVDVAPDTEPLTVAEPLVPEADTTVAHPSTEPIGSAAGTAEAAPVSLEPAPMATASADLPVTEDESPDSARTDG